MIVALLAVVEECDFLYLMRETELNKGNLSSHLAKLEEAGYVAIEKTYRGKVPLTLLRLTPPGRAAFDGYRKRLNEALVEHLQVLSGTNESTQANQIQAEQTETGTKRSFPTSNQVAHG
jgi:DNA-binding MarR family transcriptional regulator